MSVAPVIRTEHLGKRYFLGPRRWHGLLGQQRKAVRQHDAERNRVKAVLGHWSLSFQQSLNSLYRPVSVPSGESIGMTL